MSTSKEGNPASEKKWNIRKKNKKKKKKQGDKKVKKLV